MVAFGIRSATLEHRNVDTSLVWSKQVHWIVCFIQLVLVVSKGFHPRDIRVTTAFVNIVYSTAFYIEYSVLM